MEAEGFNIACAAQMSKVELQKLYEQSKHEYGTALCTILAAHARDVV
jgi:hypothetical protein